LLIKVICALSGRIKNKTISLEGKEFSVLIYFAKIKRYFEKRLWFLKKLSTIVMKFLSLQKI